MTGDDAGAVGPLRDVSGTEVGDARGDTPADAGAGDGGGDRSGDGDRDSPGDGPATSDAGDAVGDGPASHDGPARGNVETGADKAGDDEAARGPGAGGRTSIGGTA
jgi:hypothetical protein